MKIEMRKKTSEAPTNGSEFLNGKKEELKTGKLSNSLESFAAPSPSPKADVPSIRLSPEQIEEIHADEYSLTLFYATRVEPLTVNQLKREFPEPEPRKAQAVMERFLKVGLVQINPEGAYYSNFPDNYINYSNYRYDGDLEAKKDSKIFQLMKEFTGKSEYWKNKAYFSMDAFYSEEQSEEILEMFKAIKQKAKEFANENAKKKSIKGLKFRRLKYYDMTFGLLIAFLLSFSVPEKSYAGGNDPTFAFYQMSSSEKISFLQRSKLSGGGGNDPTTLTKLGKRSLAIAMIRDTGASDSGGGGHDPNKPQSGGGGGHDPGGTQGIFCRLVIGANQVSVRSHMVCDLKILVDRLQACNQPTEECIEASNALDQLLIKFEELELR